MTFAESSQPHSCPYVPRSEWPHGEPYYAIRPHPLAPRMSDPDLANAYIGDIGMRISGGNFSPTTDDVAIMAELGYVSLWFFLKVIAGYSGPYNEINDDLHLDMCNFRQSDYCMDPGSHYAMFLPRGGYKSTIGTHGADGWEILRWCDIRIALVNAIMDKAEDFQNNVKNMFCDNRLVAALYPNRYVYSPMSQPRFNSNEIVVPGRTRNYTEPNLKCLGMTGHAEGGHFSLLDLDDILGMEELSSERKANASMMDKSNWFKTNTKALLLSLSDSRVGLKATRYAIDDTYQIPCGDCKVLIGGDDDIRATIPQSSKGTWNIYYRLAVETDDAGNRRSIFPSNYPLEELDKMAEEDWWTYITQMMNKPQSTGLAEFYEYPVKRASLMWNYDKEIWFLRKQSETNFEDDDDMHNTDINLFDCYGVLGVDPAGTDRGISAKTSRSAVMLWFTDWEGNRYLVTERVGHFGVLELFDHIFEIGDRFKGYIHKCIVESNAMQSVLVPLLEGERERRQVYLYFEPKPATTDKVARIRNTLGLPLSQNKVYLCEGTGAAFMEEKQVFPQSQWRMDALDASEKAIAGSIIPDPPRTTDHEYDEQEVLFASGERSPVTGY